MIIITDKTSNKIIETGETLEYLENGYPLLTDKHVYFAIDDVRVHEVDNVPEGVMPSKHCYTEITGFYENPDYVEPNPYGIPDELVEQIKNDTIAQVQEGVINGEM